MDMRPNCSSDLFHKSSHHTQLDFECLIKIYGNQLLCDFTLVAEEQEIRAHKLILALSSPFFYWKFANDRKGFLNRIEIENVTYRTLSAVVGYLYECIISISEGNVSELLAAACMFGLRDLQEACRDFLKANLSPRNCLKTRKIAIEYRSEELVSIANKYVADNFFEVVKHHQFLRLGYADVLDLLSRDDLCVEETDVLNCVINWVQHDLQVRKDFVYTLMKRVRFLLIPLKTVLERLEDEEWLKSDTHYNAFMVEVFKSHILEGPLKTSMTPRKSNKRLVVVGITDSKILSMEIFDFQQGMWLSGPETFNIKSQANPKLSILGSKIYCIYGKMLKCFDISISSQLKWFDCGELMVDRESGSVAVLNNNIYTVAGISNGYRLDSAEVFDVASGRSSSIANISEPKSGLGLVELNGRLYAIGGRTNRGYTCNVECYNTETNSWTMLPMSTSRSRLGVAAHEGRIYVFGGIDSSMYFKQVECFEPAKNSWQSLPDMSVARDAPGAVYIFGQLYVIGGWNPNFNCLNSVEVFDPKLNKWSMLPTPMNTGKKYVVATLMEKSKIKV